MSSIFPEPEETTIFCCLLPSVNEKLKQTSYTANSTETLKKQKISLKKSNCSLDEAKKNRSQFAGSGKSFQSNISKSYISDYSSASKKQLFTPVFASSFPQSMSYENLWHVPRPYYQRIERKAESANKLSRQQVCLGIYKNEGYDQDYKQLNKKSVGWNKNAEKARNLIKIIEQEDDDYYVKSYGEKKKGLNFKESIFSNNSNASQAKEVEQESEIMIDFFHPSNERKEEVESYLNVKLDEGKPSSLNEGKPSSKSNKAPK